MKAFFDDLKETGLVLDRGAKRVGSTDEMPSRAAPASRRVEGPNWTGSSAA